MKCISRIPLEPIQMQVFARDANDHFYLITITSRYSKSILYWYRALE